MNTSFALLWRATVGFAIAGVLVVVVGYGVYVGRHFAARAELRNLLDEIRAAGEPLTVEELEALYPLPADQVDRSADYLAALRAFEVRRFESAEARKVPWDKTNPDYAACSDDDAAPVAEVCLRLYAEDLANLHAVVRQGGVVRYPTDFLPRAAMSPLLLQFHARLHRGDREGAIEALQTLNGINESLHQHHSAPWRWHIFTFITAALEAFLADETATERELEILNELFKAVDFSDDLKRQMREELIGRYSYLQRADVEVDVDDNVIDPGPFTETRPAECAELLRCCWKKVNAAGLIYPDALHQWGELEKERNASGEAEKTRPPRLQRPLIRDQANFRSTTGDAWARAMIQADALRVAIAVERYRIQHGRRPTSIEDLVPEFLPTAPIDPYNGLPLKLLDHGTCYFIYSIGPNGRDDRGIVNDPNYWNQLDVGIAVRHRPTP